MPSNSRIRLLSILTGILFFMEGLLNNTFADDLGNASALSRGAQAWAHNCSRCHNMRPASEFSGANWHTIVQHMRIQAGLTGQEARDIYLFLAAQSPKSEENTVISQNTSLTAKGENYLDDNKSKSEQKLASAAELTTSSEKPSKEDIELGKKIYHQTCIACHGANGKGAINGVKDITGKNSPLVTNSEAIILKRVVEGYQEQGAPMAMPPKGGNPSLTEEQIKAVLHYMKQSFAH